MNAASPPPAVPVSFAALRHRGFRAYFLLSALAMMADNIEHVISYWVIHERFDSPALGGFAVVSHWLPFLLLSVYSGALADRVDPRRMIQLGMALFAGVSVAWGVLFGYLRLRSGSMWPAVFAHGALNASAGLPLVLFAAGTRPDPAFALALGISGWIACAVVVIILLLTGEFRRQPALAEPRPRHPGA